MSMFGFGVNIESCYFIDSIYKCDIDGCDEEAIIINSNIHNGRRCLEHAPDIWISTARENLKNIQVRHNALHSDMFHLL